MPLNHPEAGWSGVGGGGWAGVLGVIQGPGHPGPPGAAGKGLWGEVQAGAGAEAGAALTLQKV